MARTAVTFSISMPAPTRELLDGLREGRPVSEYVRSLVEQDAARRALISPAMAQLELARARHDLPPVWLRERQPDLLEPNRECPSVERLAGATAALDRLDAAALRPAPR
jgi:hypothetical protein